MSVVTSIRHRFDTSRLKIIQFLAELLLVALIAITAAQPYLSSDPRLQLDGLESDWLTYPAYYAAQHLREFGRIPLWQPYIGHGEPSVEQPIAFTFNPFSMLPSLIFGAELGIRYSVVVHVILAGVGGWAIGKLMGFSMPARLLLAILMLAKGSMPAVAGSGYFQLGVNQAYLPWAVAGALAIVRFPHSRVAVALLAIMLTLLHLAGLIYYLLPAIILVGGIALIFSVRISRSSRWKIEVDITLIKRFALAAILMLALSAVTFIPVLLNYQYIGGHPNEYPWSVYERPVTVINQLFTLETFFPDLTWSENYNLFTIPAWYAALLFVALPPFWRRWSRPALPYLTRRVLIVMLICGVFFVFWGTGTNPLMRWANENLPLIGQWRVLSRLLTVVSLALAVVIAIRFDSLWRAVMLDQKGALRWDKLRPVLGAALIGVSAVAASDPLKNYTHDVVVGYNSPDVTTCVQWLRENYPGHQTVMSRDYYSLLPYTQGGVVFAYRAMDFKPMGKTPTIYPYDLTTNYARFVYPADIGDAEYWIEHGYQPLANTPSLRSDLTCFLEYPDPLPYAFAAPRTFLETYVPHEDPLPSAQTRGLTGEQVIALPYYDHRIDVIGLTVQPLPDQEAVVVLQEIAWNGWTVSIDGNPAPLESVGQMIGVTLPAGTQPHQILFRYDPPLFKLGAIITIFSAAVVALWLLRVFPRREGRKPL